jgi:hypothetical protein
MERALASSVQGLRLLLLMCFLLLLLLLLLPQLWQLLLCCCFCWAAAPLAHVTSQSWTRCRCSRCARCQGLQGRPYSRAHVQHKVQRRPCCSPAAVCCWLARVSKFTRKVQYCHTLLKDGLSLLLCHCALVHYPHARRVHVVPPTLL